MASFLVMLEGQREPTLQIWHHDAGRFVGCAGQKPIIKHELPDLAGTPWTINTAVHYVANQEKGSR